MHGDIRPLRGNEWDTLYNIDAVSFERAWHAGEYAEWLAKCEFNRVLVVEDEYERPQGFMCLGFGRGMLKIGRIAVRPLRRREGLAWALISHAVDVMLLTPWASHTWCQVPEDSLPMQLLMRAHGFLCNEIETVDDMTFYNFDLSKEWATRANPQAQAR